MNKKTFYKCIAGNVLRHIIKHIFGYKIAFAYQFTGKKFALAPLPAFIKVFNQEGAQQAVKGNKQYNPGNLRRRMLAHNNRKLKISARLHKAPQR